MSTPNVPAVVAPPKPPVAFGARGVEIKSLDEVQRVANMVVGAGLTPKSFATGDRDQQMAKVSIAIMHGASVGLSPMQSLQNLCVINGKVAAYGDALPALTLGSGLLETWEEWFQDSKGRIEDTDGARIAAALSNNTLTAVWQAKRKGSPTVYREFFGMDRARKAGLLAKEGPWQQYPDRMLRMRARAWGCRTAFPDVLLGLAIYEEVLDEPQQVQPGAVPLPGALPPASSIDDLTARLEGGQPNAEPRATEARGTDELTGPLEEPSAVLLDASPSLPQEAHEAQPAEAHEAPLFSCGTVEIAPDPAVVARLPFPCPDLKPWSSWAHKKLWADMPLKQFTPAECLAGKPGGVRQRKLSAIVAFGIKLAEDGKPIPLGIQQTAWTLALLEREHEKAEKLPDMTGNLFAE